MVHEGPVGRSSSAHRAEEKAGPERGERASRAAAFIRWSTWPMFVGVLALSIVGCVPSGRRACVRHSDCRGDQGQDGFCTARGFCARECSADADCPCGSFCAVGCGLCIRNDCAATATCFALERGVAVDGDVLQACAESICAPQPPPRADAGSAGEDAGRADAGDAGQADGGRDGGPGDAGPPRVCGQAPDPLPICVRAMVVLRDAGATPDAGTEPATDAGMSIEDSGADGGADAGTTPDAGTEPATDAGMSIEDGGADDGGAPDGGFDAG